MPCCGEFAHCGKLGADHLSQKGERGMMGEPHKLKQASLLWELKWLHSATDSSGKSEGKGSHSEAQLYEAAQVPVSYLCIPGKALLA